MFIPDPDFFPSRIQPQKIEGGGIGCLTFYCSHKFHKISNYLLIFEQVRIVTRISKILVGDPGSDQKKTYAGLRSRGQKCTDSVTLHSLQIEFRMTKNES
jgi:hypothetical protein